MEPEVNMIRLYYTGGRRGRHDIQSPG